MEHIENEYEYIPVDQIKERRYTVRVEITMNDNGHFDIRAINEPVVEGAIRTE